MTHIFQSHGDGLIRVALVMVAMACALMIAAGHSIHDRRRTLAEASGIATFQTAPIDQQVLAALLKRVNPIWFGLTQEVSIVAMALDLLASSVRALLPQGANPASDSPTLAMWEQRSVPKHALVLLEPFRVDVVKKRNASLCELVEYCRLCAMSIGRLVLDAVGEDRSSGPVGAILIARLAGVRPSDTTLPTEATCKGLPE